MNKVWDWITGHSSSIYGFLGILVTIYVGVYKVPNWLIDVQNEKIRNAQENLIQSIKELVYADSTVNIGEINALIEAKRILLNDKSILSPRQLLLGTQESFMQDKYLPLDKRRELLKEIEVLKGQINPPNENFIELKSKKNGIWGWLSIVSSIFIACIGSVSLYVKSRNEKAKQEEIDNQLEQVSNDTVVYNHEMEFEDKIQSVLANIEGVEVFKHPKNDLYSGFDFAFTYNRVEYFVEIKYLQKSKVGLASLQRFISKVKGQEGNFWFIYNTGLTELVRKKVETLNKISVGRNIEIIKVDSIKGFEETAMFLLSKHIK